MKRIKLLSLMAAATLGMTAQGQQVAEKLNRAPVAVKASKGVLVSWRSLKTDGEALAFNVLKDGVKLNAEPITSKTNYLDASGEAGAEYTIEAVENGSVVETSSVKAWESIYTTIQLDRPAGGTTKSGDYTYTPNDMSVGDVDGDGDLELVVKWDPSNSQDNSLAGYTGEAVFDCYEMDGTKKWRVNMGVNVRAGAHYSPFLVYDFDGDGKAEFVVRTGPGTTDGTGAYVSAAGADEAIRSVDNSKTYLNSNGHVTGGEEFLTVFDGETGAAKRTVWYNPNRACGVGNADMAYGGWEKVIGKSTNYNRGERYNACVAYLDGEDKVPSIVMQRGYYTYAYVWAVDWDGTDLKTRWLHRSTAKAAWDVVDGDGKTLASGDKVSAFGQGVHGISVGDVNLDGLDEIVLGSATIAPDGKLMCSTGLGHGDAIHLSDLVPDRPGLEVMMPHEEKPYGFDVHDAATGEKLVYETGSADNGRGMAGFFVPGRVNAQFWSSADNNVHDCGDGSLVDAGKGDSNFRIYWNGDLYDDTFDGRLNSTSGVCSPRIMSWNGSKMASILEMSTYNKPQTCNWTKGTPCLQADLLGDWREELIMWSLDDPSKVMIYSTPIETTYKVTCLLQDHVYRMGVAWQNSSYNQPPHLGYSLSDEMDTAPTLSVAEGPKAQSVILGDAMQTVSVTWRKCGGVTAVSVPAGVKAEVVDGKMVLSGTPTEPGTQYVVLNSADPFDTTSETVELKIALVVKQPDVLTLLASYAFDGTLVNSVEGEAVAKAYTASFTSGVKGQAIDFAKGEANGRLSQASYEKMELGVRNFTISLWFAAKLGSGVDQYLLQKGSTAKSEATGRSGKWVGIEYKNDKLTFSVDDDVAKSSVALTGASSLMDGTWHHLVCVRNVSGKQLLMYVDGAKVAEATDGTGNITETEEMVIGNAAVGYDLRYTGAMDELMIYAGTMEPAAVKSAYEEGVSGMKENAVESVERETVGDDRVYELGGRRVSEDYKGLKVVGGKLSF